MPLDIFVPFWGDPALLRETVESVLAQRTGDWLLTVVDDAYPDPSVARWFETIEDPRVRYLRHEHNRGKSAAVNTALACALECGAEVLILLDGDGQHHPYHPCRCGRADSSPLEIAAC